MIDSIAFVIFVGLIFYVIYQSVVKDDLAAPKKGKFGPVSEARTKAVKGQSHDLRK